MATHNSRPVNQILELFAFGFCILAFESTLAASSYSLLLCPDSSSAILCAEVCKPLGQISYSIDSEESEISKTESLVVQTMTGNIFDGAKKSSSQVGVVLD